MRGGYTEGIEERIGKYRGVRDLDFSIGQVSLVEEALDAEKEIILNLLRRS